MAILDTGDGASIFWQFIKQFTSGPPPGTTSYYLIK